MSVRHPDEIPNLAADCRRVLRADYAAIQVAANPGTLTRTTRQTWVEARNMPDGGHWDALPVPRMRTRAEIRDDVAAAIAEYRKTAALWGVIV